MKIPILARRSRKSVKRSNSSDSKTSSITKKVSKSLGPTHDNEKNIAKTSNISRDDLDWESSDDEDTEKFLRREIRQMSICSELTLQLQCSAPDTSLPPSPAVKGPVMTNELYAGESHFRWPENEGGYLMFNKTTQHLERTNRDLDDQSWLEGRYFGDFLGI